MNDQTNRSRTDREQAEGDRSTADENVHGQEPSAGDNYDDEDDDNAGGITNRTLDEEIENQQALPERGKSQADELGRSKLDVER